MAARLVTGYVNLNKKPTNWDRAIFTGMLDDDDYRRFGAQLIGAVPDAIVFENTIAECWLSKEGALDCVEPVGNSFPQKYTLDYMITINQKIEWLRQAALACDDDVLVWVDYGIFKYAREGSDPLRPK